MIKKYKVNFKKFLKDNKKLNFVIFIMFLILSLVLAFFHEPWRDEAQSWLLARDLNIIDLFKQMKYEGHPCFWHLILKFFISLGLNYKYINFISCFISIISVGIFLKVSKFKALTNACIVFSPTFLYYCSTLARSYSLCLLSIVLLIWIYDKRKKHPYYYGFILLFMLNTHILMFGFVIGIILIDLYDIIKNKDKKYKTNQIISLIISFLGMGLLFLQIGSANKSYWYNESIFNLKNLISSFNMLFINFFNIFEIQLNNKFLLGLELSLLFILILKIIKEKNYKLLIIFILGILFQLIIFTYVHSIMSYMTSITFLILLFCLHENKYEKICMLLFMLTIPSMFKIYVQDIKYNYSYAEEISQYIEKNIPENSKIFCTKSSLCSSIIPYLNKNYYFINPSTNKYFTFINWNNEYKNTFFNEEVYETLKFNNFKYYISIKNNHNQYINNLKKRKKVNILYTSKGKSYKITPYPSYEEYELFLFEE